MSGQGLVERSASMVSRVEDTKRFAEARPGFPPLRYGLIAALLATAALLKFYLAPLAMRLAPRACNCPQYQTDDGLRIVQGDWQDVTLRLRREDQVQIISPHTAIVQSRMELIHPVSKQLIFELDGTYGVDRISRENLALYGDRTRNGHFFLPPNLQEESYTLWDSMHAGPLDIRLSRHEIVGGLSVFVFDFDFTDMDQSHGYRLLDQVGEGRRAYSEGRGALSVEPLSGIVVAYWERGTSYLVDASSGDRVADFHRWERSYTEETQDSQIEQARGARLRLLALRVWLPLAALTLASIGLSFDLAGHLRYRRAKR